MTSRCRSTRQPIPALAGGLGLLFANPVIPTTSWSLFPPRPLRLPTSTPPSTTGCDQRPKLTVPHSTPIRTHLRRFIVSTFKGLMSPPAMKNAMSVVLRVAIPTASRRVGCRLPQSVPSLLSLLRTSCWYFARSFTGCSSCGSWFHPYSPFTVDGTGMVQSPSR